MVVRFSPDPDPMAVVLQEVRDSGTTGVDYDWRLVFTGDIDYQFYLNQCAQYNRRNNLGCGYYPTPNQDV